MIRLTDRCTRYRSRLGLPLLLVASILLMASSCDPLIATYNQRSYEHATSIKAEASVVMKKSTGPYADHEAEVEALMLRVEQAYEYAKGIPNNENSAYQWALLKDPKRNLLGGFMAKWKKDGTVSAALAKEQWEKNVAPAFDEIITLEVGKIGSSQ